MYVVQPSFSQKCVEFACLRTRVRATGERKDALYARYAVTEPGVGQLMYHDIHERAVANEESCLNNISELTST